MEVLIFKVKGTAFGVDAKQVIQIVKQLKISKEPNSVKDIDGLVNVRDIVIEQIDLEKLLFSSENKDANLSIICKTNDDKYISLRVEGVKGLYDVESNEFMPVNNMVLTVNNLVNSYINKNELGIIQILSIDNIIKRVGR